jgi:hemerythrin-like domain-containing protein
MHPQGAEDDDMTTVTKRTAAAVMGLMLPLSAAAAEPSRPSDSFRKEHQEIQQHLAHVREWAGMLTTQKADEQRKTARRIVAFFVGHIKPHAEQEERGLYPLVDRLAGGSRPFTSSMRHEHRIVGRWIGELEKLSSSARPDYTAFARRTDNLLGLISAHFEEEEEVLLPIIDAALTAEQFEQEMRGAAGPGL